MLGVPVDVASEVSVAAPTVLHALAAVRDRLAEDIPVSHPPPPGASSSQDVLPTTSWNQFQHRLQGTGLTRAEVAQLYLEEQKALSLQATTVVPGAAHTPRSSAATGPTERALEQGYVLIRAPEELEHLRGHHQCGWSQLLRRLGLTHQQWSARRAQFFMPKFVSRTVMEELWAGQGLRLPVPLDPGGRA